MAEHRAQVTEHRARVAGHRAQVADRVLADRASVLADRLASVLADWLASVLADWVASVLAADQASVLADLQKSVPLYLLVRGRCRPHHRAAGFLGPMMGVTLTGCFFVEARVPYRVLARSEAGFLGLVEVTQTGRFLV